MLAGVPVFGGEGGGLFFGLLDLLLGLGEFRAEALDLLACAVALFGNGIGLALRRVELCGKLAAKPGGGVVIAGKGGDSLFRVGEFCGEFFGLLAGALALGAHGFHALFRFVAALAEFRREAFVFPQGGVVVRGEAFDLLVEAIHRGGGFLQFFREARHAVGLFLKLGGELRVMVVHPFAVFGHGVDLAARFFQLGGERGDLAFELLAIVRRFGQPRFGFGDLGGERLAPALRLAMFPGDLFQPRLCPGEFPGERADLLFRAGLFGGEPGDFGVGLLQLPFELSAFRPCLLVLLGEGCQLRARLGEPGGERVALFPGFRAGFRQGVDFLFRLREFRGGFLSAALLLGTFASERFEPFAGFPQFSGKGFLCLAQRLGARGEFLLLLFHGGGELFLRVESGFQFRGGGGKSLFGPGQFGAGGFLLLPGGFERGIERVAPFFQGGLFFGEGRVLLARFLEGFLLFPGVLRLARSGGSSGGGGGSGLAGFFQLGGGFLEALAGLLQFGLELSGFLLLLPCGGFVLAGERVELFLQGVALAGELLGEPKRFLDLDGERLGFPGPAFAFFGKGFFQRRGVRLDFGELRGGPLHGLAQRVAFGVQRVALLLDFEPLQPGGLGGFHRFIARLGERLDLLAGFRERHFVFVGGERPREPLLLGGCRCGGDFRFCLPGGVPFLLGVDDRDADFRLVDRFHGAEADLVAVVEFRLDDRLAVYKGLVGGVEILEPVAVLHAEELRVPSRDGGVLELDAVVGFPADGDDLFGEPEGGFRLAGRLEDQAAHAGRPGGELLLRGGCVAVSAAEDAFHGAEADVVGVVEERIRHGHAVDPAFVGRAEILEPEVVALADELGVVSRDRGVLNLDDVFGRPPDSDHLLFGEFVCHGAGIGEVNLQRGHRGKGSQDRFQAAREKSPGRERRKIMGAGGTLYGMCANSNKPYFPRRAMRKSRAARRAADDARG